MKTPTDIASLARLILSTDCKSVGILTGAGISVASVSLILFFDGTEICYISFQSHLEYTLHPWFRVFRTLEAKEVCMKPSDRIC